MKLDFTVRDFIRICGGELILGHPYAVFDSLAIDSRTIKPKDFFLALPGEKTDGHKHIPEACERGAGGLILSSLPKNIPDRNRYSLPQVLLVKDTLTTLQNLAQAHRKNFELPLAGITGTNGKTTTKNMLSAILSQTGENVLATKGNLNSQIGLPLMVLELTNEHKWAVLEMGASKQGEIEMLAKIASPKFGIITNIGPAHLETFGNVETIAKTKWELAENLPPEGELIINMDDSVLTELLPQTTCRITTFGINSSCDVHATEISAWPRPAFTIHIGKYKAKITLTCTGKINIYNALGAAACAWRMGVSLDHIVKGLEGFEQQKMRMEEIKLPSGAIFINDAYNANPVSFRTAIETLIETYPDRERIVVIGEMLELGEMRETAHKSLGALLAKSPIDSVFVLGSIGSMISGGARELPANNVPFFIYETREELVTALSKIISNRSAVLFKASRGIHLEEIVAKLQQQ